MKVLVTGGAGRVGQAATERLVRQGWEVRVIGLETGVTIPGAEFVTCDILNYDDVRQQMRGCHFVVHLAAIASPSLAPGQKVFQVNTAGTFNVFEAAAAEGIRRIVQASSINALGCAYNLTEFSPAYLPVDEEHPSFTTDPYSFSKEVIEDIGRYYWRREGISSVALRFPGVHVAANVDTDAYRERRLQRHRMLDEFVALPESERRARLDSVRERVLAWRKERPMEYNAAQPVVRNDAEDPLLFAYGLDRFNLWASIDARDAAQALEKGLTASYEGAQPLFVNDNHNWLGYDSQTLARLFFPEVSPAKVALSGTEALVSIARARKLIGFEPEYSVESRR